MPSDVASACAGDSLEAGCYRAVRQVAADCAEEIDRRFPKVLRRVGGYNLDEFVDPAKPFNLAKLIVGSEGTLGLVVAAKINLVPLPKAKAVLTIEFDDLLDALAATPGDSSSRSVGGRGDGPLHPRPRAREPGARRAAALHSRHRPRGAVVRGVLRRPGRGSAAAASGAGTGACGIRRPLPLPSRAHRRRPGAHLELPRGVARPVDGDEGRRQVALVRRGHGRRAREAPRLHRSVSPDRSPPRHGRRRLRARVGRLPARAAGREPQDRRGRAALRGDRERHRRSGARVRRGALGRARRWAGPRARSPRRCSAPSCTRHSERSRGPSIPTACSTRARSSTRRR